MNFVKIKNSNLSDALEISSGSKGQLDIYVSADKHTGRRSRQDTVTVQGIGTSLEETITVTLEGCPIVIQSRSLQYGDHTSVYVDSIEMDVDASLTDLESAPNNKSYVPFEVYTNAGVLYIAAIRDSDFDDVNALQQIKVKNKTNGLYWNVGALLNITDDPDYTAIGAYSTDETEGESVESVLEIQVPIPANDTTSEHIYFIEVFAAEREPGTNKTVTGKSSIELQITQAGEDAFLRVNPTEVTLSYSGDDKAPVNIEANVGWTIA